MRIVTVISLIFLMCSTVSANLIGASSVDSLSDTTFTGSVDATTYSNLPAQTDVVVWDADVDGGSGDRAYNHHPIIKEHNGIIYLMFSTHDEMEDAAGMYIRWATSDDNGDSFTVRGTLFPQQSAMDTGTRDQCGRYAYPSDWVIHNDEVYAVADINRRDWCTDNAWTHEGLLARKVNSDFSLDTIYYIHPVGGLSAYWTEGPWEYSGELRSALIPGLFEKHDAVPYAYGAEVDDLNTDIKVTCNTNDTCLALAQVKMNDGTYMRIWRNDSNFSVDSDGDSKWTSRSLTGEVGAAGNWSTIIKSGIPDTPSVTAVYKMSDRYGVVGNDDSELIRDPLFYCQSQDGLNYSANDCYKVRSGLCLSDAYSCPTYTGQSKHGGAQYPDLIEMSNGEALTCYSIYKEDIACTHFAKPDFN